MYKKALLIFISLFFLCRENFASHIVGGEIYYDCLGSNNYRITLKIYRNCYDGQSEIDDPAYIFIFGSAGEFIDSLAMPLPGTTGIPSTINHQCFTPPDNICVEQGVYQRDIHLPPRAGGYDISFQRCCRTNSIINVVDPGMTGSTYTTHIPDPSYAPCNSSPHFTNFPPVFLCTSIPLNFDHSAQEADGDSLYYEFCDPSEGASPFCPFFGPQGLLSPCSEISEPPPYAPVAWQAGYNASYPIASSPVIAIDPHTGVITGTPTTIGQWVMAVCVSEYRNGVFLGVNKRDFLFNVITCYGLPYASIPAQTEFCNGYQYQFSQNSVNMASAFWNFGDPTTSSDYSYAISPSWTYPGAGTYTASLIINMGTFCSDTTTMTVNIQPKLEPEFNAPGGCLYNNNFNFTADGAFEGSGTFAWNFGSHANPQTANMQNVNNVVYDTLGTFAVTLTVSENGCTEEFTDSVKVYDKPTALYGLDSPFACLLQAAHFTDSSKTDDLPLSYEWTFGDGGTSSESQPYHSYSSTGTFSTGLIISSAHGCKDTFNMAAPVNVFETPYAGFSVTPTDTSIFYPDITISDNSSGASSCRTYWGDGSVYPNCDSVHQYTKPGTYHIMQVVTNPSGCSDTAYSEVLIRPEFMFWIPNAFTPGKDDGLNDVFKPKTIGVREYSFVIFNRWGEKVFETQDPSIGWDGSMGSGYGGSNVFVYKISFRDDVRNDPHEFIGHVTVIR
ncbi:MAG TPA: PKD domain-containing protein [Bacteroidia bacterium]|jgi:gliding motility-associated-like protein